MTITVQNVQADFYKYSNEDIKLAFSVYDGDSKIDIISADYNFTLRDRNANKVTGSIGHDANDPTAGFAYLAIPLGLDTGLVNIEIYNHATKEVILRGTLYLEQGLHTE